jgi:hypothetical protein
MESLNVCLVCERRIPENYVYCSKECFTFEKTSECQIVAAFQQLPKLKRSHHHIRVVGNDVPGVEKIQHMIHDSVSIHCCP